MLSLIAAAAVASTQSAPLESSTPWWEKVTVTVDGQGNQQSCLYEFSLSAKGKEACDDKTAASLKARATEGQSGLYSKMTFERRFSPDGKLDKPRLQAGDTLLGQQVMFLTFDADGSIGSCRVLATSGDMRFSYGCEEAQAEQFRSPASARSEAPRQAFMTILAYGHKEQIA